MPFGPKGLVVTWVGPVPSNAAVTYTDGSVFAAAARITGPEIPADFPAKYRKGLREAEMFNASMSWDTQALTGWERRHGIETIAKEPLSIFENYLKEGNTLFSTLVTHPPVPDPKAYSRCSVVLQRGVIVYANGKEDLFLRSYFHSVKDDTSFVNFVPRGGLRITFEAKGIWFPLELTRVIEEPASFVVLDVLTTAPLNLKELPRGFVVGKKGKTTFEGRSYQVVRLTAKLSAKERSPDLRLRIQ